LSEERIGGGDSPAVAALSRELSVPGGGFGRFDIEQALAWAGVEPACENDTRDPTLAPFDDRSGQDTSVGMQHEYCVSDVLEVQLREDIFDVSLHTDRLIELIGAIALARQGRTQNFVAFRREQAPQR
jgi:hypothetical protein